jgi:hypothetical protein
MVTGVPGASTAANNLIDKISNAIGIAYEPRHVKQMSKAAAEALIIAAEVDIKVTDFRRSAAA